MNPNTHSRSTEHDANQLLCACSKKLPLTCPCGVPHYSDLKDQNARYEAALRWMADYRMTGTEQTLHIDFQGKAREVLNG